MVQEKIVEALRVKGLNIPIWNNIFGIKINFDCGECGFSQSLRVPLIDYPVVECKHCRTLNKIPVVTTTYGSG